MPVVIHDINVPPITVTIIPSPYRTLQRLEMDFDIAPLSS